MSKEAIIFAIDAGSSMDQKFIDSQSSRLKIALECLKMTLQQKLFNNSSHQIGFGLFGQNQGDSDDGNNTLLRAIGKPDLQFVRKVVQLSEINLNNSKPGGDIFSAVQFMIQRLSDHCGTKKYNKRAFLFTNGRGSTQYKESHFRSIVSHLKENDIKLNIIPMDFMETYDFESNQLDSEIFAHPTQEKNSQMLITLRGLCPQNIQIFPASLAIQLYKKFRRRDTNPVAIFKGKLQIAPNMEIQVCTYKAIRKQKLKSLSKLDLTQPFDRQLRKQKQIENDINYIIEGEDGAIIDKQQVMNAYQFGSNLVPMNDMVENNTKIFQDKNFTLLGFVESQKIPRHCFLGEVDIVVPQKENQISRKLFSAFIYSMLLQKKYAIARYVPRNSKRGVTPRIVVLIPFRSPDREMFYLTQLPTIEGVRDYPFNSLKKSTEKQNKLVRDLVDKMLLFGVEDGKQKQEVKIQNIFNPYRQYFYQTIFYRALNENQHDSVPQLDEVTRKYITPEMKTYQKTSNDQQKIKKQFKMKLIQLNRDKIKQKKVIVWKDVLNRELSDKNFIQQTQIEQIPQDVGKKFTFDNQEDDKFNPSEPIISFKKMINNNKKDLVSEALDQLTKYIKKRNHGVNSQQQNDHLVECANELRKGCIEQKETQFWDNWFGQAKNNLTQKLYHLMKIKGIGYINRSNQEIFRVNIFEMRPVDIEVDELD